MAQISIIQKSDINQAGRFDAEYFKPEYLEIDKKLKNKKHLFFKDFSFITDGIHSSIDFDDKSNILLFSAKAPKENTFDISSLKHISKQQHIKNPRTTLQEGDVIISTVGTIGNCAVITKDLLPANSDRHVGILRPKNISSYFLSTFLLSKYGKMQSFRNVVGNVQPNLYIRDMNNFILPVLSSTFQQQIEKTVKQAHAKQTESKTLYQQAEQLLLTELGLVDFKPKYQPTFSTTKGEVEQAERFDAEYFQPKYKQIMNRIENYIGGFALVKNVLDFNKTNFFPEENEFYNYIPLSKVSNIGEIEVPEKELGKNLPTRARRKIKQGEIILSSISGSLETSAIIGEEHNNFIASNGFYVFSSQKINPETLLILFKSKIMLEILQKISKGAILGGYDLTAFEKLTIPLIKPDIQNQIAQKITLSHQLRKQSKDLLEQAKKSVEVEIENQASQH